MAKRRAKMTDEELLDVLTRNFNASYSDKEQYSQRYGNAWRYYHGMEPRDQNNTGVEPAQVVREVVEENFQVFKTLFNDSTSSVVTVRSNNLKSDVADKISTELNTVAMNLNQISRKMEPFMKEALLTGQSHMKVYLQESIFDDRREEFENKTQEWIDGITKDLKSRGFNDVTINIDEDKTVNKRSTKEEREQGSKFGIPVPKTYKLFSGSIRAISREIKPQIDYVPFENMYIHPFTQYSLEESPYVCQTYMMSINEGLKEGWDEEIMSTGVGMMETDPNFSTTGLIVGQQYNPFNQSAEGLTPIANDQYFQVFEHYWRGTYKGKVAKLWRVFTTKTQLLEEPEEVLEIPFVSARVMEVPNSFYGEGIYDTARVIQDSKTRELRMLTYTAQNNAYGRFVAIRDSYDKDSLADNRAGGVVEVEAKGAIELLPTADISQAMQLLMNDTNERMEAQLKSAGNMGDALEKFGEASGVTTSMIINKSEQGIRSRASTFAETGLVPLYKKLYRLLQEIEHPIESISPGITMADLPKEIGLTFDVSTLADKQQDAQNVLQALQMVQQLNGGALPQWVGDEGLYNATAAYIQAGTGDEDVSSYVTDPKTIKPSKAQLYVQALQYMATVESAKAMAAAGELQNAKTLSEIRVNDAKAAYEAAQMATTKSADERENELQALNLNNLILQNAKLAADIESEKLDTALSPIKVEAELNEIESGIVAEQANIANQQYAQGANVNVN
ncbi:portal protein [Escherichia coli]